MKDEYNQRTEVAAALIYCRVSSTKQRLEGSGLESQEQRCRVYADEKGYLVEAVFPDDVSGGGDFMRRPGMVALLSYLDAQRGKPYVVIFDDLKRFARDTEFHLKLRREFARRGATIECLNFRIEDTPEGKFIETVIAAQGELEREQNRRQVVQKMKARVENGFWVFRAPVGYRYINAPSGGGKVLVPDEVLAPVVRQALEGYATGHFASQAEVQRFLERNPHFPKDKMDGTLRPMTVSRLLKKVVYAGYVEAPKWGVSVRKGHHEGLIEFETYQQIQDVLEGKKRRPAARADINEDFPLRGFVACDCCGNAMTGAWSKGKYRHYAYYRCQTRNCESKGKSVPVAKMDEGFASILKGMQPAKELFELAKAMLRDAWNMRLTLALGEKEALQKQLADIDGQLEGMLDRIVEANSASVVRAYESRIDKLERDKLVLQEKINKTVPPKGRLEDCIELSLKFLSSPWNIWKNGDFTTRQTVLRLAFNEPLRCSQNGVYETPNLSFPFRYLGNFMEPKSEMVL
ncbi:recombinase family protein [Jannaschia sp. 2305UL9-9]|uniref:recombinase family protein n=1 Tax=Jannaschia sp. 2305UL9-9 TaxID=3121638 RepID=UPI003527EC78